MAELTAQVTFRVSQECYDRLQEIASSERRKMNEAARALLERGMCAYDRDKKLFEPENGDGGENHVKSSGKHVTKTVRPGVIRKRQSGAG